MSIDAKKDEVFVDFGGKAQGIAQFSQFETEPKVGDEVEFHVERYDPREGLLILNRKGAAQHERHVGERSRSARSSKAWSPA